MRSSLGVAIILLAACSGPKRATLTLPLEPVAYADTLPIEPPEEREVNEIKRLLVISVGGEIGYGFSLRRWIGRGHEAVNLTRFDDVVSSAWFEHRIGTGRLSPQEAARGPTTLGPDTSRTLTVVAGKAEGISPGFTIRDARGDRYLVKLDPKGNLHMASAAGVISGRLFYAAGYNTPEDYIVVFDAARLAVDPEAEITVEGEDRPMTEEDLARVLALTDSLPNGRYLALASKFVPGRPIGPFFFSGVRRDDPNDYYHHEYRRELRGLYVVSSWLNHVDMRFANTLDAYIDPPGYVRHYLIDFAATLGSGTIRPHKPREGSEFNFAFWPSVGRVLTLGFYQHGWEGVEFEEYHSSLGWFPAERFEPGSWRANWPNAAFRWVTPADGYWGAKLVAGFSDEHIRSAIKEGHLPTEEVERTLARILAIRRDKIVRYWYGKVTPIEQPEVRTLEGPEPALELAFDDLGLKERVWEAGATRYEWMLKDVYHQIEAAGRAEAGVGARQRITIPLDGLDPDLPGVAGSKATATLRIRAIRGREREGRQATVLLRWNGAAAGYSAVGLRH
ncbi:MAG: hypothetical protein GWN99_05415 [Gemmatimonadetes bacterium]|uniref:Uncharacterized protein n=1 Tax=Candidatus Kutchimonas denitrificans TaxID=3056748 RepID=A0AAE5CCT9_9BACT|nr:hypothetical protein [Gemmatimonadota bacterium]NIR76125.1 hypothetical protein [Candidatus Kutchimonas denitrificans]NIS00504.1 hypothetical protein [Gemmatimonadota bacterium]NIT66162.1 hypothetical protein [Gemmatimonadota bacterium]NIU54240.1 hypothetical protein [Gemmatimonadota bacterium]